MNKFILVGADLGTTDLTYSMKELGELVRAVSGVVVGSLTQKIDKINSSTFIGKGKILEVRNLVSETEADIVVFNNELSGSQLRNIEEMVECEVIDRTALILEIFAARAKSKEGKLQVELAQLKYRLPRLEGFYTSLSRIGGGIGARGLGEQQLELDRRVIKREIHRVEDELKRSQKVRENTRLMRQRSNLPLVSLVGYTNAGKSTILNRLVSSSKKVFVKDMLFATLDPSHRRVHLLNGQPIIMSDTVGFISDLPTSLIEAFKSTLEEIFYADLILIIIDASNKNFQTQLDTTMSILKELNLENKPMIIVFNKIDKFEGIFPTVVSETSVKQIYISALYDDGMVTLLAEIEEALKEWYREVTVLIPYKNYDLINHLSQKYEFDEVSYLDEGIKFTCVIQVSDINRISEFLIN